jgi:hypothetical protein
MARAMQRLIIALLSFVVAACAADTANYPSLARREAEKVADAGQPAIGQAAPAAVSPELAAHLIMIVNQAQAAHDQFDSRRAKAEVFITRPGSVGSDSWSNASVALADLESARSNAMIALADLDEIYAAERVVGRDASAIVKARDSVIALVRAEDGVLAHLRGRFGRR